MAPFQTGGRIMTQALLVRQSANKKTGPIATITIENSSCPAACPLKNGGGCYAERSPMHFMWNKVSDHRLGVPWDELCSQVEELREGSILRYGQAGDLPGVLNEID